MRKIIISATALLFGLMGANASYTDGNENGHGYVDLGLTSGTMWAAVNLGASSPEDYGNYYAWGETATKTTFSWETYLDGNITGSEDCWTEKDKLRSVTDIAGTEHDAAKANWGGKWTMPTTTQQEELSNECYWVWTSNYDNSNVAGFIVYKAKTPSDKGEKTYIGETASDSYSLSDAHIFLPATGYKGYGGIKLSGSIGYYWSSSLDTTDGVDLDEAWFAYLNSSIVNDKYGGGGRYCGMSVRAVCTSPKIRYKDGIKNGHEYVDLGLPSKTLWAAANIGADSANSYGNYYAWGETATKTSYSWDNYLDGNISSMDDCGTDKDALKGVTNISGTEHDAAKANWGGDWVMPDTTQFKEIEDECYWVWTSNYNNSNTCGCIVYKAKADEDKGKMAGSKDTPSPSYSLADAHIFLPAAGFRNGDTLHAAGSYGYYWLSLLNGDMLHPAWAGDLGPEDATHGGIHARYNGQSVRPVIAGEVATRAQDAKAESKKAEVKKVMKDGVIYIIKGDEVYGVNGNRVK